MFYKQCLAEMPDNRSLKFIAIGITHSRNRFTRYKVGQVAKFVLGKTRNN